MSVARNWKRRERRRSPGRPGGQAEQQAVQRFGRENPGHQDLSRRQGKQPQAPARTRGAPEPLRDVVDERRRGQAHGAVEQLAVQGLRAERGEDRGKRRWVSGRHLVQDRADLRNLCPQTVVDREVRSQRRIDEGDIHESGQQHHGEARCERMRPKRPTAPHHDRPGGSEQEERSGRPGHRLWPAAKRSLREHGQLERGQGRDERDHDESGNPDEPRDPRAKADLRLPRLKRIRHQSFPPAF